MKKHLIKRELLLAGISIMGIVVLSINLTVALYHNSTVHSEMTFRNDALSRSNDLDRYFSGIETILSVFISDVETMRCRYRQ